MDEDHAAAQSSHRMGRFVAPILVTCLVHVACTITSHPIPQRVSTREEPKPSIHNHTIAARCHLVVLLPSFATCAIFWFSFRSSTKDTTFIYFTVA